MKMDALHACLRHWSDRSNNGKVAFRFKTVKDADFRGSPSTKKRHAPPSDDEQEDEEEISREKSDQESMQITSEPAEVNPGKGKRKAKPVLWYD